jgi:hypothetical protein
VKYTYKNSLIVLLVLVSVSCVLGQVLGSLDASEISVNSPMATPVATYTPSSIFTSISPPTPTASPTPSVFPLQASPHFKPTLAPITIYTPSSISTPTPTASPTPSLDLTPTPIPTASPTLSPEPTPIPIATPSPTPEFTPTPIPTATPTLIPTDSPTPSPDSPLIQSGGNSLPLTGFGGDYLVFHNHDPSEWNTQLQWFTQYRFTGARLSFSFPDDSGPQASTYVYAKMDIVLTKLYSVGVRAILCDFPADDSHFYGSQAWVNNWKQLASDFKGDSRIAAFQIANEPYQNYLASNANTMSSFNAACSSLIDQIRTIDPSRTIMYPEEFNIFTNDIDAFYNDLVSTGIMSKGNIIFDITHPYYFQDSRLDGCNNPIDRADGLWYSIVLPQIQKFGVSNVWSGETFPWPRGQSSPSGVPYDYNLQQIFEQRMINYFVSCGLGFQMWCFFSSADKQAFTDALNNSQYYTLIHG